MSSFDFTRPVLEYLLWQGAGFLGAFFVGSFIEWFSHKFILHSNKIVGFAYQLHDVQHHNYFNGTDTYSLDRSDQASLWKLDHVRFVLRDYVLFLLVTAPLWIAAELLIGRPLFIGGVLAVLFSLQLFNSMHWRYHVPSDTWFQRTWFFRYLKEHHRLHHETKNMNLNVAFFPIADFFLRTLRARNKTSV
jgi:hypothetical protein